MVSAKGQEATEHFRHDNIVKLIFNDVFANNRWVVCKQHNF